jgi:hypothetical protein
MPPMASRSPGALSRAERRNLIRAWELYERYERFVADVAQYHQQLTNARSPAPKSSDQSTSSCPPGTALAVLSDDEAFREQRQEVGDWARAEYADRFEEGTRFVFSSVSVGISAGIISGSVGFNVGESGYDQVDGYRTTFVMREAPRDSDRWFVVPERGERDFLWFDFSMAQAQDGYISAAVSLNEARSRINGSVGWLERPDVSELGSCARQRLNEAYRIGTISSPGGSGGGGSGGRVAPPFIGGGGGSGGGSGNDFRECNNGVCCSIYTGECYEDDQK